ncbi:hypothetical protein V8C40DRAFT_248624 [Trichoderma camerunense]
MYVVALPKFPRSILGYAQYSWFGSIGESQARRSCSTLEDTPDSQLPIARPLARPCISIWAQHSEDWSCQVSVEYEVLKMH